MDLNIIKPLLTDTIPWIKMSDIRVDVFEERRARLTIPVEKHLNHVGIVYAGTHFMLMEVTGAALFAATYGVDRLVPINKSMEIKFLKPATTDITCDLTISKEEADIKIEPVEKTGKGDWVLNMETTDANGITVSTSVCNYYIIPTPK